MKTLRTLGLALAVCLGSNSAAEAVDAAALTAQLTASTRSDADKARDTGRKPGEVVAFLGIQPGMTVVDLIAAGGYYTEVLSIAVGSKGKVYAQNNRFVLEIREGANEKAISARLAEGRLPNVERLDREMQDLGLTPESVDAAVTALNFHDIVNSRGPEAATAFLASVYAILKPGGIFGVIDHRGDLEKDNKALHRMPEADARKALLAGGFELAETGDMLRNPDDDHSQNVFAPGMRGNTDRFVLLLRKPSH